MRFVAAVDPAADTRQLSKARELLLSIVDMNTERQQLTDVIATAQAEARQREKEEERWRQRREEERTEKHWRDQKQPT